MAWIAAQPGRAFARAGGQEARGLDSSDRPGNRADQPSRPGHPGRAGRPCRP